MDVAPDIYDIFPIYGEDDLFRDVERRILPEDSMLEGTRGDHIMRTRYFSVGASAIAVIREVLRAQVRTMNDVREVLDYACGYGRVHRWLRIAFPQAIVRGVDADAPSVAGANHLGFDAEILDLALKDDLGKFDLIWIGSLFTHLSYEESVRTLKFLRRQLSAGGALILTTHGSDVFERIRSGATYGLKSDGLKVLLQKFHETGWGYVDYPDQEGYGISLASPEVAMKLLLDCDMTPILFRAVGWDKHQDVYACAPTNKPTTVSAQPFRSPRTR